MRRLTAGISIFGLFLAAQGWLLASLLPEVSASQDDRPAPPSGDGKNSPGGGQPTLFYLTEGSWVEVEGAEFHEGRLIASKIALTQDDDAEIEGVISWLDADRSVLGIGEMEVFATDSTRIVNRNREVLQFGDLSVGMRVKAKIEDSHATRFEATLIRHYTGALDSDFELQGPVEKIRPDDVELTVLGVSVVLTEETRHVNPPDGLDLAEFWNGSTRGIRRDDDDPEQVPIRLGPVYLGGRAGVSYRLEDNFNLNDNRDEDSGRLTPRARLEVSLPVGEHSELYSKLSFTRGTELTDRNTAPDGFQFTVKEAFFYWGRVGHRRLALQIGRQRFRDKREWTYDDYLDAVRLHARLPGLKVEFSAAKGIFGPGRAREEQLYLMGSAEHRFAGQRRLRGYVISRHDSTPRDDSPIWWGLSSRGRLLKDSSYWAEMAFMSGHRRQKRLGGFGVDVGASYRFPLPWRPTLAVGYAFGSGDNDGKDGIERTFRQTQLQDNSHRIGGLKRYNYYGILLDPELSNLKIPSLQAGIRPLANLSFDLLYHNYRQVVASRDIGDWDLDALPNGRDPRLGQEIDLAVAYRIGQRWELNLFTGIFYPGPAFGNRAKRSFLFRPAFQFHF